MATFMNQLPTLTDRPAAPQPKGVPHQVAKAEKKKTKVQAEKDFRSAVWARDKGRSRASGKPLAKSGTSWDRVGEVHHVLKRSTNPEERLNPENGILLSKSEHALAETPCPADPSKCLLTITGSADLSQPQLFVWIDVTGKQLRRRTG